MSINKIFLPSVEDLKKRMSENEDGTINWLSKGDAFLGPQESHDYVKWIFDEYLPSKDKK
jgi:hypothetical protein